jgi:hypothetical protein
MKEATICRSYTFEAAAITTDRKTSRRIWLADGIQNNARPLGCRVRNWRLKVGSMKGRRHEGLPMRPDKWLHRRSRRREMSEQMKEKDK